MSKVICDICGTTYQDTADSCPICGSPKEFSVEELEGAAPQEEEAAAKAKAGRAGSQRRNREVFDYDAVNVKDDEDDDEDLDDEEDAYIEEEDKPKSNTFLVILLTILIILLLAASGFIFLRYIMPNLPGNEETTPSTAQTQPTEQTTETTVPTVPCQSLVVVNDTTPELCEEGQQWLLHVKFLPEDTTDTVTYISGDESVVTVSEDGRVTVVGEGQTIVRIICGTQMVEYPIVVDYSLAIPETTVSETIPEMEVDPTGEVTGATEATDATESTEATDGAGETTEATEPSKAPSDVTLKLGKSDITLGVGIQYQMPLNCDLKPEDIEWSIEHTYIARVDDKGNITTVGVGTTMLTAKYGDQEVQCWIRVKQF